MILFGLIGYLMRKTGFEPAPLIMAYILCPFLEEAFRQSLIKSRGDLSIFFRRPISASILSMAGLILVSSVFTGVKRKRRELIDKVREEEG